MPPVTEEVPLRRSERKNPAKTYKQRLLDAEAAERIVCLLYFSVAYVASFSPL